MYSIHDTNVIRRLAAGELELAGWKDGTQAVVPAVMFELMTKITSENLETRKTAVKFILDNEYVILPSPSTDLYLAIGLNTQSQWNAEQADLIEMAQNFINYGKPEVGSFPGLDLDEVRNTTEARFEKIHIDERQQLGKTRLAERSDLDPAPMYKRFYPKWLFVLERLKRLQADFPDVLLGGRVSLELLTKLVATLETYLDLMNEHQQREIRRTGSVDRNDRTDLIQLFYIHDGNLLYTGDEKWLKYAERCGHQERFRIV